VADVVAASQVGTGCDAQPREKSAGLLMPPVIVADRPNRVRSSGRRPVMERGMHRSWNVILLVFFLAAAALPAAEFSTYIGDENTWHISRLRDDASGNTNVAGSRTFDVSYDTLHPDLRT
jgi:hypothetical protein